MRMSRWGVSSGYSGMGAGAALPGPFFPIGACGRRRGNDRQDAPERTGVSATMAPPKVIAEITAGEPVTEASSLPAVWQQGHGPVADGAARRTRRGHGIGLTDFVR